MSIHNMATLNYYNCSKCDFRTSVWWRMKIDTMLKEEGLSSLYCVNCDKQVSVDTERNVKCPVCGGDQFIGHNVFKCPKCQSDLVEEEGPVF